MRILNIVICCLISLIPLHKVYGQASLTNVGYSDDNITLEVRIEKKTTEITCFFNIKNNSTQTVYIIDSSAIRGSCPREIMNKKFTILFTDEDECNSIQVAQPVKELLPGEVYLITKSYTYSIFPELKNEIKELNLKFSYVEAKKFKTKYFYERGKLFYPCKCKSVLPNSFKLHSGKRFYITNIKIPTIEN